MFSFARRAKAMGITEVDSVIGVEAELTLASEVAAWPQVSPCDREGGARLEADADFRAIGLRQVPRRRLSTAWAPPGERHRRRSDSGLSTSKL
jgi:hypothetical protein